ncbi:MAG: hypothetical protein COA86_15115 [Kangiella sp.]|nr:MAG: hypothetical protein COA86_15115 [Kangiella sp.]
MKEQFSFKYCFLLLITVFIISCNSEKKEAATLASAEAKNLAMKKIRKYESLLKIKVDLLPPLEMSKEDKRFVFQVEDEKQNIWVVVSVMFNRETNVSSLALDEKRNRSERAKKLTISK